VKSDLNPKLVMSALHGGHYWGLRMHYNGVFHGHRDSDEHVNDVINFLDMWFFIETGYDKLSPQDKERVKVRPSLSARILGSEGSTATTNPIT
jgi:hypothetical protein